MNDCLFCRITKREIPAEIVDETELTLAFKDIHPVSPCHVLLIPKKHIATLDDLTAADEAIMGCLMGRAKVIAQALQLTRGYRLIANCQRDAGQEIFHIHFHLLGGRKFGWPPG
jgi:histidine triad (HIT) family protein